MKKIVMIDQSETFTKFVSRTLTKLGYEVFHAFNLESALAIIAEAKPNLVTVEINVPNYQGAELCEKLCGGPHTSTIPIVVITTDGNDQSRVQARKAGCSDYLTKPLTIREIHQMLQRNLPFAVKRQMIRLDIEVDAIIRTKDQTFETRTKTLGEGGMLVQIDHPALTAGSLLEIFLRLSPVSPPLEVTGEVIYILDHAASNSPRGVGIKFSGIRKDTSELLKKFIEQATSTE
jgi:CheY-like chemotaxis protein/Tfp pilus assembly protein PilZ